MKMDKHLDDGSGEFSKFVNNIQAEGGKSEGTRMYIDDENHLATMFIHNGLFLEYKPIIDRLLRNSLRLYSTIPISSDDIECCNDNLMSGYLNECIVKLVESQPMKSYLKLTFRQVMKFILRRSKTFHLVDLNFVLGFMNELRTSYSTICSSDKQIFKPTSKLANGFKYSLGEDASFLVYWAAIEAAKYCICHKFAPDLSANEFLSLLQKEAALPVSLGDKITRRFLANFLLNLDKFLSDRVLESSTQKLTFNGSPNIEQFFTMNSSVFRTWLFKDRGYIANLSLINDDPAETWRNVFKHFFDLTSKFHGYPSSKIPPSDWMHLTSRDWSIYLNMISLSARQLEDTHLLYGIRTLTSFLGTVCSYNSLEPIILNFEGRYQCTYDLLKGKLDLDEQNMIEFLDSCIELNLLEENREQINNLKSKRMQGLYEYYLESTHSCTTDSSKDRFAEVQKWLSSWSNSDEFQETELAGQPLSKCLDLIIPTCLNLIVKAPTNERQDMIERSEWLIGQDFMAQSLFPPCFINKNIKVFNLLIDLLKGMNEIPDHVVGIHANDLYWNNLLFRHLFELNLIDKLHKPETNNNIDLIQFRAAKYNLCRNNNIRSIELVENLLQRTNSEEIRSLCAILSAENCSDVKEKYNHLIRHARLIKDSKIAPTTRDDLMSKILRRIMKLPVDYSLEDQELLKSFGGSDVDSSVQGGDTMGIAWKIRDWENLFSCCNLESKAKTYNLFSKNLNERLNSSSMDSNLLNSTFHIDLKLLELLCQSKLQKHKSCTIDCAARILKRISCNFATLNNSNLNYLTSNIYLNTTINIWIVLKTNLISMASYKNDLSEAWRNAIVKILKHIGRTNPFLLIYNTIVNRLDIQSDIVSIENESSLDPATFLLPIHCDLASSSSQLESRKKLEENRLKLQFWDELFDEIMSSKQLEASWHLVVQETERFLKELRKISFLCGEYFKTITIRIPKRFHHFLDHFSRFCDTKSGKITQKQRLEEYENRLKTVCDHAINQIKILLCYGKKTLESPSSTKYDIWFYETFNKHLLELEYRINLLSNKKPIILNDIEKLIKSITELFGVCRNTLLQYNQNNRQKLYMELISPLLSRLEPSLIPMPDCCNNLANNPSKPIVTIFKISQTVNLIISKTSPKKLKFTGSDGISRSFLLKAHEDLRLDQLVMDLFASINILLMGSKAAQNRFKVRLYSVTPVSSRSGLIQWIEAPSLCSSYRTWLNSVKGKEVIEKIYTKSCPILCDTRQISSSNQTVSSSPKEHFNCTPPQTLQTFDPFYQLLWMETKPTKNPLTDVRPSCFNSLKYRTEFEPIIFQRVVERLAGEIPKELLSNQIWFKSHNSYSYWMKTQRFIHSCSTMSIIGYIIGLGDRHPENILLDYNTGEVIHIDYNICFELGKTLPVPEKVPFRLTHDIIHALGFAGLEGGFTHSSRIVLDILKNSKTTLLHLLDPINLKFMIGSTSKIDETTKDSYRNSTYKKGIDISQQLVAPPTRLQDEVMDMCSQESIEVDPPTEDITDLLMTNKPSRGHKETNRVPKIEMKSLKVQTVSSLGLQHNIKTPTKILHKTAIDMYERLKDKLSGTDEQLRHQKYRRNCGEKLSQQKAENIMSSCSVSHKDGKCQKEPDDLIMLNDAQTTEDQIDALIFEATSFKNKSAMYEGWVPWV